MAGACDGKVALVTGASRGLGKAIAQRLAGEGATVGLTARTLEPDPKYHGSLQQTLDEITTAGGTAIAIQADMSKSEEQEHISGELVEKFGEPDVLVSNAAFRLAERLSSRDVSRVCQNWIGSVHWPASRRPRRGR